MPVSTHAPRMADGVGVGRDMPSDTKNKAMKKSRRLVTFERTSPACGRLPMVSPATSAPISADRPVARNAALPMKHHASADIAIRSGAVAMNPMTFASSLRVAQAMATVAAAPPSTDRTIARGP